MDFEKEIKSIYNSGLGGFINPWNAMSQIGNVLKRQTNTVSFGNGTVFTNDGIIGELVNGSMIITNE
ncbi:hypothetical protein [Paenibacillus sp. IHBB 10380]|uniref:hypothetical protein n=1 Tax=Paenibacillus sp. IHBB 10380 TaxID=1566358 RepID=UPI0005CFD523|nr:hypothetical protein [Paenibacillus sp. IHBB 10380]AJS58282.1 hypothetical protein UB51_06980 [Paenibacillus sp. IHBB 10380]